MSYTVHNFVGGEVLYAEQLNEMDDEIKRQSDLADDLTNVEESVTNTAMAAASAATNAASSATDAASAATAAQAAQTAAENAAETVAGQVTAVVVSSWLNNHINPQTGYAVDTSLLVSNAAADSRTVGDEIRGIKNTLTDIEEPSYNLFDISTATVVTGYIVKN